MKKMTLLFAAFFISQSLMANTIETSFKSDNPMPKGLKVVILETLEKELPCLTQGSLLENGTTFYVDSIDQGVNDVYYTTNFTAYTKVEQSITKVNILVESVDYEIHNPRFQRYRVENLESDANCR